MSGCWLWTAAACPPGYGRFRANGRSYVAHRFAWEIMRGPIPAGLCACHKCDTPACVNPDHLFLGTQADNVRDSVRKKRHHHGDRHYFRLHPEARPRGDRHGSRTKPERRARGERHGSHTKPDAFRKLGEKNPAAKMTAAQVLEIRALHASGWTRKAIGDKFGRHPNYIALIVRGRRWQHLLPHSHSEGSPFGSGRAK